jgi:signal transduction histidine kinase
MLALGLGRPELLGDPPNRGRPMKLRPAFIFACVALVVLIYGCLPVSAATRHIVLLFDERVELPGLSLLESELVRSLRSNSSEPVEIYREAMDLSRFGSNSYKTLLRDFLRSKYADKEIDVAVAVMLPAFEFLLANGELIFPGTPIVFCGLDKRQLGTRPLPPNAYGVLIEREFAPTLDIVLRLHPAAEKVVVVSGSSEFDADLLSDAREEFRPYEKRVSFAYLPELPLKQVLEQVSQLPANNIVLFITMFRDGAGEAQVPHDVVERVSKVASVPVYGFLDQYLGRGIVGGSLYSSGAVGGEAARMALALLAGAKPPQKLVQANNNKIAFDWRQMHRWGISENRLPPGSEIDFRERTVWQRYPWQIAFIFAIILVQASFIIILMNEHRRRRLAEVQSRQRMAELAHVNRFSTAGELTSSIAHEINQPLGSILTNAETAKEILTSSSPDLGELSEIVDDILQDNLRASEVIRRMRSLLRKAPFELKNHDLNDVARDAVGFISSLTVGRKVELASRIATDALPILGDHIQLQQVIINLVVNGIDAMKDTARENRIISIRTSRAENFAELSVSDRGPGIPEDKLEAVFEPFYTSKAEGMGMGLSIARTIIEAHNGLIGARNRDHGGTTFRIRLPLVQ